uniref:O-fucosyltransferase family protein n=1 Tax=Aegilops tauschii TaxID=37682 RepID=M8CF29_AEGTA
MASQHGGWSLFLQLPFSLGRFGVLACLLPASSLMTSRYPNSGELWMPCVKRRLIPSDLPTSNGYLIVEANGGLNQQRLSICDAVAVASLLNATLVIPIFHLNNVWRDPSKFSDIFDEDRFIGTLRQHVRVVKELPKDVLLRFNHNISSIPNMRTKAYSSPDHYVQKVLPKLMELGVVRIAPFSNRLAQSVPSNIQALRCLVNYEALRFAEPIRVLADDMVVRMMKKSSLAGGKYVSVHLRFEEDMVAFSCCTYDGGRKEKIEMENARERSWRGKFHRPGRVINPEANRRDGKCPLTPLEVGMMLRGMGFDNTTFLYVASGKIYNAAKYMAPLRQMFPLLQTKDTLALSEELAKFEGYSSRLAALDYTVCVQSEVFVTTQGGNFPHFLMGHRRYLLGGNAKTIKPDKRKLVLSFDDPNIRWSRFKHHMLEILHHSDIRGIAFRKPNDSIYTFPMPDCMCQQDGI